MTTNNNNLIKNKNMSKNARKICNNEHYKLLSIVIKKAYKITTKNNKLQNNKKNNYKMIANNNLLQNKKMSKNSRKL